MSSLKHGEIYREENSDTEQNKIGINRNKIHVYSSKKYVFQMIEFHGISTIREEFLIN